MDSIFYEGKKYQYVCPIILNYWNNGIPHSSRFAPGFIRNDAIKE